MLIPFLQLVSFGPYTCLNPNSRSREHSFLHYKECSMLECPENACGVRMLLCDAHKHFNYPRLKGFLLLFMYMILFKMTFQINFYHFFIRSIKYLLLEFIDNVKSRLFAYIYIYISFLEYTRGIYTIRIPFDSHWTMTAPNSTCNY